jgi:NAD(P)-dependent dehydrogenase (short-subunit alcohol dehydrogenase family)
LSVFATISAKVGSISDNRLGGWYAYRASKAALNMFIKNIAIEFARNKKKIILLSLHPGTTKTELSEPFTKNTKYQLHTPIETAKNLLSVIENKTLDDSGKFFSWDGEELPW